MNEIKDGNKVVELSKLEIELLSQKKEKAEEIIRYYTAAATAVGAVPIPFADAPLLIGGQVKMIKDIFEVYDLKNNITTEIIAGLLIQRILSQGAKFLVKYLLKKISFGIGTVINATMAGAVTYALGKAISEAAYNINESFFRGDETAKNIEKINKMIDEAIENSFKKMGDLSEEVLDKVMTKNNIKVR
ncbi:MAG: DUF697 domain-containing protein [Fusobacteriaceae bacterium]